MDPSPRERAEDLLGRAELRRLALPERGVELALLDWGGDGPLALLHHANGFCKGVWALVADGLRDRYRVVALDARGHGDSSRPEGAPAYAWEHFALDCAAAAGALAAETGRDRVALAIGHSFGGTATLAAARRSPERFGRILLVDPVVPPRPPLTPERAAHVRSLVDGARQRRAEWPSRQEAFDGWSGKDLFAGCLPEALWLYVLDGLRVRADGSVALKCPGEVEAAVFASGSDFDVPAEAVGVVPPALFLWAARGSFRRPVYEAMAATMRDARVETVDAGHLVPMERPDLVLDAVARFADGE